MVERQIVAVLLFWCVLTGCAHNDYKSSIKRFPASAQIDASGCVSNLVILAAEKSAFLARTIAFEDEQIREFFYEAEKLDRIRFSDKDLFEQLVDLRIAKADFDAGIVGTRLPLFFLAVDPQVLEKIAYLEGAAEQIIEVSSKMDLLKEFKLSAGPEDLRRQARVMLSRLALPNLEPGQVLTDEEFLQQAKIAGKKVQEFDFLYRLDSRSPNTIVDEGGFFPNENKQAMTLIENSLPKSNGGGNFVSTTSESGSDFLAMVTYFKKIQVDESEFPFEMREVFQLNDFYNAARPRPTSYPVEVDDVELKVKGAPKIERSFEYKIEKVNGIRMGEDGDIEEAEVVANYIPESSITEAREVFVVTFRLDGNPRQIVTVVRGDWAPLESSR